MIEQLSSKNQETNTQLLNSYFVLNLMIINTTQGSIIFGIIAR